MAVNSQRDSLLFGCSIWTAEFRSLAETTKILVAVREISSLYDIGTQGSDNRKMRKSQIYNFQKVVDC